MHAIQSEHGSLSRGALGMSLALCLACAVPVEAAPIDLLLTQTSTLTNEDDGEGRWQYDGGEVRLDGDLVGYYSRKKRVSDGTSPLNTAAVEITLFAVGESPPQNITLQGAHSFNNGDQTGSVSAASSDFSPYIWISFFYDAATDLLTLNAP